MFRRIERPEPADAPPRVDRYHTIGQFYAGIELGLSVLAAERDIFTGDPARQVSGNTHVYGMAGAPDCCPRSRERAGRPRRDRRPG